MGKTQKHDIIGLLWDGKHHTTGEIIKKLFIAQYNARIKELRAKGFEIIAEKNLAGQDGFRLTTPVKLIDFENLTVKFNSQRKLQI